MNDVIKVGDQAPEFTAVNAQGEKVSLEQLRAEGAVLVVFYPFAFSGICTGELHAINRERETLTAAGVTPVVLSCDAFFTLDAFAKEYGYEFPLLSDHWPHGEIAKKFGVFVEEKGCAKRGSFLIGQDGKVLWSVVNELGDARNIAEHVSKAQELLVTA